MSREIDIKGKHYIINRLPLHKAQHIWRRIEPAFIKSIQAQQKHGDIMEASFAFAEVLSKLSDSDYDYFYYGTLSCIKRKESDSVLVNIVDNDVNQLRYQDIGKKECDLLLKESMAENFEDFLDSAQPDSQEESQAPSSL